MILFLSLLVFTIPIAHCNERDEVQEWIAELKDEDPRIRQTAAEILGRLKDPRAIGPLILALVDEASEVREAAFEALKNFLFWEKSDAARSLVPKLIEALRDENPWARFIAAWSLGEIKDPRAVEPLIATLKDKDFRVRWNAAKALGEIGDPKAVKPLIAALKDENSGVRSNAAWSLGEIQDPKAVEPLITTLKDENSDVRGAATAALGWIEDPKAVKPLIAALKDENSGVRSNAAWSLGKITKEHFGREVAKWEEWLKKQKAGE
jgi:HEAT repeat protein